MRRRNLPGKARIATTVTIPTLTEEPEPNVRVPLHCRVHGDLFKPGPFEFVFHQFWLTRRGMLLAENRPPDSRSKSETFLDCAKLPDLAVRREAVAFRDRPRPGKNRKQS